MALVTVHRSPSGGNGSPQATESVAEDEVDMGRNSKSLNECYFAGKGTALVLPAASEAQKSSRRSGAGSNIQKHLQSMFYLLRSEETLKMAVKLESVHPGRTRYLVVVSRMGAKAEESCLLGIDCNEKTTVGLVLKVLANTTITLDGDGGFSVQVCDRNHIFKPVSVQAMWSALQTLHKVSSKARDHTYYEGGLTHEWVKYYEDRIESDRSCLNEWHAMDSLESRRPPSPDSVRNKPTEREETERVIRSTLKEIMMSVDLDDVTSKYIRGKLEEDLDMDLGEFKSFIDQEMLTILGQMDAPTEIFEHVYLGSEWNASNYEELQRNGVGHILNVTREIDNFFPGTFDYLNIRVYDDEKTDLLKHWDNTFKYITKAKDEGSKVLVHCKMGISRSASVVIAYAMKAYNWDFGKALKHVKEKRSCIKPNTSFIAQLETYQGILDAMKNKEKLQRSKSETNLKSPTLSKNELVLAGSEPTPIIQALSVSDSSCQVRSAGRPKSWSPCNDLADALLTVSDSEKSPQQFRSMENLNQRSVSQEFLKNSRQSQENDSARNVLLPCDNGESYSVSPNQIMHITNGNLDGEHSSASVKERINELESKSEKKLVPKTTNKTNSEVDSSSSNETQAKLTKTPTSLTTKTDTWDPGEKAEDSNGTIISDCDLKYSDEPLQTAGNTVPDVRLRLKTSKKNGDPFSNQVDKVFDREERKQNRVTIATIADVSEDAPRNCPSRQGSWSSYDSAVVLGYQGETREVPSRHSSWGSGDTRTVPSRNSSWGSYDMRSGCDNIQYDKEDIPWFRGTVKRTKQKLEESRDKLKNSSETLQENDGFVEAINKILVRSKDQSQTNVMNVSCAIKTPNSDFIEKDIETRLSVSAPERSSMELVPQDTNSSLSRSTSNIDSKSQYSSARQYKSSNKEAEPASGLVKNLKKEFEAKTNSERVHQMNLYNIDNSNDDKTSSLPSINTQEPKPPSSPTSSDPGEDLKFKEILGKFENPQVMLRPKGGGCGRSFKNPTRHSCIEVSVDKKTATPYISSIGKPSKKDGEFKRPPLSPTVRNANPNVVVATVIAKANKKQQQQYGKSHPLALLNIKPKHNNPVYNTM